MSCNLFVNVETEADCIMKVTKFYEKTTVNIIQTQFINLFINVSNHDIPTKYFLVVQFT